MSSVILVNCPQTEGSYDAAKLMKKMDKNDHSNPFFFNKNDLIAFLECLEIATSLLGD